MHYGSRNIVSCEIVCWIDVVQSKYKACLKVKKTILYSLSYSYKLNCIIWQHLAGMTAVSNIIFSCDHLRTLLWCPSVYSTGLACCWYCVSITIFPPILLW